MQALWFQGVKESDKRAFKESLQASSFILDKLAKICYNTLHKTIKEVDFDSPSWAYKQAYDLGYNKALEDVSKFLDVSTRDEN